MGYLMHDDLILVDYFKECVLIFEQQPDIINLAGYDFDVITDLALHTSNEFRIKIKFINLDEGIVSQLSVLIENIPDLTFDSNLIKSQKFPIADIIIKYHSIDSDVELLLLA